MTDQTQAEEPFVEANIKVQSMMKAILRLLDEAKLPIQDAVGAVANALGRVVALGSSNLDEAVSNLDMTRNDIEKIIRLNWTMVENERAALADMNAKTNAPTPKAVQ
jgi:hypothetical protein